MTENKREKKIGDLMSKMSLSEKVGQMTQINLDALSKGEDVYSSYLPFEFDDKMVDEIICKYKVGSIFNTAATTAMSTEQWEGIIKTIQQKAIETTGIPVIYGIDSIHGATYTAYSTLTPQAISLGATFNRDLVYQSAKVSAYETRASNIPWVFSPVLDLGVDPRWPRMWETYGEDSYLISEMGAQATRGYQGENNENIGKTKVAACLKHYMGYGSPFSGRDRTPAYIAEHELREKHFAPYVKAIREGALSVMVNSGLINDIPTHCDYELLTVWLKEDLEWDGVIVTDWADIDNIWHRDKVAKDRKEAIKLAINAGIDMSMVPHDCEFCELLMELVAEQKVSMERIDDAVARILRLKLRLGLFDNPYYPKEDYREFGSEEFKDISYKGAAESITLLKNNNDILPLAKNAKIFVCGPNADSMRCLNGGWSYSWQGEKVNGFLSEGKTILKALQDKFGRANVDYLAGVSYNDEGTYDEEIVGDIDATVKAAAKADYIILCLGENSYSESPGNLDNLFISEAQTNLALALVETNKPIILILNEGRPRLVSKFEDYMTAIVQTYLPGTKGAIALADILTGDVNPSGKLPYTYPKHPNNLSTYDYKPSESLDILPGVYNYDAVLSVQWWFGYGLSYTKYGYSNLTVNKDRFCKDDILKISVDVQNVGGRDGKESVLLYVNDLVASLTPDVQRLRRFDKVEIVAGETKQITFTLPASELAFVGADGKWVLEEGEFMVRVEQLTTIISCIESYKWEQPNIPNMLE